MKELDIIDQLINRLSILEAQATIITGEGADDLARWSGEVRANYLWGIAEGVRNCRALANNLSQSKILAAHFMSNEEGKALDSHRQHPVGHA